MKAVRSDGAVPAHTDWLVDSLIAGGVLVPRLDATWESVTSVGSRAKRAKATRVSYTLVGSVRVSESVCRVLHAQNCNVVLDLNLKAVCADEAKAHASRPFTRLNVTRPLLRQQFDFRVDMPAWRLTSASGQRGSGSNV